MMSGDKGGTANFRERVWRKPMELKAVQQLVDFLEDYASFLEDAIQAQNDKLEAVLTHDVTVLESSVAAQQNLAIQMDMYEKKREKFQAEAGFSEKTLTEIAQSLEPGSPEDAKRVLECHSRMSKAVDQIKFLNSKAMHVVETSLHVLNLGAPPSNNVETYTERAKKIAGASGQSIFQTKI